MKILFDQINSPWWCNRYSKDVRHNELSIASAKNTPAFLKLIGICKCSEWKNNLNNGKAIYKKAKAKKIFKKLQILPKFKTTTSIDVNLLNAMGKNCAKLKSTRLKVPTKQGFFKSENTRIHFAKFKNFPFNMHNKIVVVFIAIILRSKFNKQF